MAISSRTLVIIVTLTIFTLLIRRYTRGCRFTDQDMRLDGKVVVVTGANTGIGKETALDLARRGAQVVMACRSLERGRKAADDIRMRVGQHVQVEVMKLDLSSLQSVRTFAEMFKTKYNKLHILVNNAAIITSERQETEDGFEMQFGVNHLGHFLLTNLLLDQIKMAAPSRIINVSSMAHMTPGTIINFDDVMSKKSYGMWGAYSQSKLANILFTLELSKQLEGTGVSTYSLHPGGVDTDLARDFPVLRHEFVRMLVKPLFWPFIKSAEEGAQTTITCALSRDIEKASGKYFSECVQTEPTENAQNEADARKLWSISEQLVGLDS